MHFSFLENLFFGLLFAAWLVYGSNFLGDTLVSAEPLKESAYKVATDEDTEAAATEPAEQAAESALTMLASADPAKGLKVFKKCAACHTTDDGGKNKVGPNLWDVVGRAKGAGAGFAYSKALKAMGGDWSYEDLDAFLEKPKAFMPGTKMSFAGLKKSGDRAAVILFLRGLSAAPKALP